MGVFCTYSVLLRFKICSVKLQNYVILHNCQFIRSIRCILYSSHNTVLVIKSRRMRWVGHVARMGEERGVYRVLVGKPEGRRPLGRPRPGWVGNIRMDL